MKGKDLSSWDPMSDIMTRTSQSRPFPKKRFYVRRWTSAQRSEEFWRMRRDGKVQQNKTPYKDDDGTVGP
jgi:hypothetical protein